MKRKKILYLIILILLIANLIGITLLKFSKKEDDNTTNSNTPELIYNQNQSFLKDQSKETLLFSNIACSYNGTTSYLSYTITNVTEETYHLNEYNLLIKDKDGNELSIIEPNYNVNLDPGEEFYIGNTVNVNLTEAYSLEITLK